MVRH
jgi:hypothetical protein